MITNQEQYLRSERKAWTKMNAILYRAKDDRILFGTLMAKKDDVLASGKEKSKILALEYVLREIVGLPPIMVIRK